MLRGLSGTEGTPSTALRAVHFATKLSTIGLASRIASNYHHPRQEIVARNIYMLDPSTGHAHTSMEIWIRCRTRQ